ncbi:MAG: hypothetical protein PSX37_12040, partial [bacterium]|nr:hypothetical protein [bacterium]
NSVPLRIGTYSSSVTGSDFEFVAALVFRFALTPAQIQQIVTYFATRSATLPIAATVDLYLAEANDLSNGQRLAVNLPANGTWRWWLPASGKDYIARILSRAASGATTWSARQVSLILDGGIPGPNTVSRILDGGTPTTVITHVIDGGAP